LNPARILAAREPKYQNTKKKRAGSVVTLNLFFVFSPFRDFVIRIFGCGLRQP
jgi:hypothetical protein